MRFQKLCKICKIKPLLFKTQWEIVLFEFVCRRERSWRCGRWIKSSAESEQEDWSCFSKKPQGANNSWMMARQHTSASVTSVFLSLHSWLTLQYFDTVNWRSLICPLSIQPSLVISFRNSYFDSNTLYFCYSRTNKIV